MAKKLKIQSTEVSEIKDTSSSVRSKLEKILLLHKENPDFNRSQAAEVIGVSRRYIQQILKKLEEQGAK